MKSTRRITILTLCILVLFTGCSNLFNMLFEPIQSPLPSVSSLLVKINDGSSADSSRVIAPLTTGLVYTVSLFKGETDTKPVVKANLSATDKVSFDSLNPGSEYIVRVLGEEKDGNDLLTGEAKFTAKEGENRVSVTLAFINRGEGTGSLVAEYELSGDVPGTITAMLSPLEDGGNEYSFDGTGELSYKSVTRILTLTRTGIDAGTYILSLMYEYSGDIYYFNIDPIVEIVTECESRTVSPQPIDTEDAIKAGFTYYIADSTNSAVDDVNNSGFRPNVPVTLNKVVGLISDRTDITDEMPAKIVLLEDITIKVPETFVLEKSTRITSAAGEPHRIKIDSDCDSLFQVGPGTEPVTLTLENIILSGNLSVDTDCKALNFEDYKVDVPLYSAFKGLVYVMTGELIMDYESYIMDTVNTDGYGGGVYVGSDGKLTMNEGCYIQNCTAYYGGGVYVENDGDLEINGGLITGNSILYDLFTKDDFFNFGQGTTDEEYLAYLEEEVPLCINAPQGSALFIDNLTESLSAQWSNLADICTGNMHFGTELGSGCAAYITDIETEEGIRDAVQKAAVGAIYVYNDTEQQVEIKISDQININSGAFSLTGYSLEKAYQGDSIFTVSEGAIAEFLNVSFEGNSETGTAGSLVSVNNAAVRFNECYFQYNLVDGGNGAGLYVTGDDANVYLQGSYFNSLTAHKGGAVYINGGECVFSDLSMTACTAEASGEEGGFGGGIYINKGNVILTTDTESVGIYNCASDPNGEENGGFGGAVYVGGSGTGRLFLDGIIIGNGELANTASQGGGVYVAAGGELYLNAVFFSGNNADQGTCFFIEDYSLDGLYINGVVPNHFDDFMYEGTYYSILSGFGLSNLETEINKHLFKGKGTSTEPYEISTANDIRAMAKVPVEVLTGTFFNQKNDITFDAWAGGFSGIPFFPGTYIGNSNRIVNLPLDYTYCEEESLGLFSVLANGSHVEGVILDNLSMSYAGTTHKFIGGLAGKAVGATIERCGVKGSITDSQASAAFEDMACGGLIGYAETSSINKSFAAVELVVKNTRDTGGLVGYMNGGSITDCYTAEYVTGGTHVGSMIGYTGANGVSIITSYAASEPGVDQGVIAAVGFIGTAENAAAVSQENTYYYNRANTQTTENSITALTALDDSNIKNQDSYSDFDFTDVWAIAENDSAPFLIWQALFYKPLYINPNI